MLAQHAPTLAEIQGLYGAFTFPEKLLQKVWLRGDFNRAVAMTTNGHAIRIIHPGKWNLLGGPDFRGARLAFGEDKEITGDVEVHLHAADWDAHGHVRDPAYDNVILHVVLFPPDAGKETLGSNGLSIPVLPLLSLLHHDLEEFAAEDAVEVLANRPTIQIADELAQLSPAELAQTLRRSAELRWRQKVHFARLRVQRLGWGGACHHVALEVLGYRFNRAPMLRVAGRWGLPTWAEGAVDPEQAFAAEAGGWSLQGVRPANQPRARLRQYAHWTRAQPDWPHQVTTLAAALPIAINPADTRGVRRVHRLPAIREQIKATVCGGALSGSRLDNFICDGVLPLLASHVDSPAAESVWFHWFIGDLPPFLTGGLQQLGVFDGRAQPACHGIAQGLLGWLLEREARR